MFLKGGEARVKILGNFNLYQISGYAFELWNSFLTRKFRLNPQGGLKRWRRGGGQHFFTLSSEVSTYGYFFILLEKSKASLGIRDARLISD